MTSEVEVAAAPEQLWAAVRQRTTKSDVAGEIRPLVGRAWEMLGRHPELGRRGRNVALYHPDGSVEVGVEVPAGFEDEAEVRCAALPTGTIPTCAYFGSYEGLGEAHGAIQAWARDAGRQLAGTSWELYGHWTDDPVQLRTDVCYLLG
jgi:hypothetical protein